MSGPAFAGRILGAAARVALDALRPDALPVDPARVSTREGLARLLDGGSALVEARPLAEVAPSSNCTNVFVETRWKGDDGPATLFVKLPSQRTATKVFCTMLGIWPLECAFYRNVAGRVPLQTPHVHGIRIRGSRFALVLEDLSRKPGVRLHTNRDLVAGASIEEAERILSGFAALHAGHHDLPAPERDALLPPELDPFKSPRARPVNLGLNRAAIGPCARRAESIVTPEVVRLFRRTMGRWDELVSRWYDRPLTLVHGDSHLGNVYFDGDAMGLIDFQAPHWGRGARDVQYFLINSVSPDVLAAHERGLVAHYADALSRHGVRIDFEEVWDDYRGFSFQTLMTSVVSLGLGPMTETDSVVRTLLERSVSAIDRLDFAGWLAD